ncbi:YopX family protein [Flavobacterium channae]|uniref:YopX family protein n=1 Tax=Flavobacterium channae TaxID=2897181 RepID=UPI001E4C4D14|nr:YopX family protein [Flavobacterium channae]UGS24502.1 YopX family protein [Flavobacterium channae]
MRKIKFRIWNGSDMKYPTNLQVYNNLELHTGYAKDYDDKGNLIPRNIFKCVLMQFTGLTAKNDIDIYEGDVLELPNGTIGIVEWFECGFVLRLKNETVWQNLLFNVANHYSVVGNIYERQN